MENEPILGDEDEKTIKPSSSSEENHDFIAINNKVRACHIYIYIQPIFEI